jgi:hypothetical protein
MLSIIIILCNAGDSHSNFVAFVLYFFLPNVFIFEENNCTIMF